MAGNLPATRRGNRGAVNADAMRKASQAYGLRVMGATWDQIAQAVGYGDKAAAYNVVKRFAGEVPQPSRELQRQMWRDRHEWLFRQAAAQVREGDTAAITAAVRVANEAAKLDGLHAPQQVDVTVQERALGVILAEWGLAGEVTGGGDVHAD